AEFNFDKIIKGAFREAVKSRMKIAHDTLVETENLIEDARSDLNKEEKKTQELYLNRLQSAREIYEFAERMLDSIFSS
ncbi:MAG: hypothetical protein U9O41_08445, partial [Candidatus Aerophobetes bacterium]|nr:hypothetical protein [Candidatus Aerophobetes bacterium]